jgi:tetratricopeptide (TPR) repeat protein
MRYKQPYPHPRGAVEAKAEDRGGSLKKLLSYLISILLLVSPALPAASSAPGEKDEAGEKLLTGRALIRSGRYFEAMERLESAWRRAERTGQHLTAALALSNMAEIQRLYGNTSEAARYYREALRNYRAVGHQDGIALSTKKIEEILGPGTAPESRGTDRDMLINQAVERVRDRLKAKPERSD